MPQSKVPGTVMENTVAVVICYLHIFRLIIILVTYIPNLPQEPKQNFKQEPRKLKAKEYLFLKYCWELKKKMHSILSECRVEKTTNPNSVSKENNLVFEKIPEPFI